MRLLKMSEDGEVMSELSDSECNLIRISLRLWRDGIAKWLDFAVGQNAANLINYYVDEMNQVDNLLKKL